jgi:hypothetical protein
MARLKKRTVRKKLRRGGAPWTYNNWPQQHNATYYPLNAYGGQIDRALQITNVGGSRRKRFKR